MGKLVKCTGRQQQLGARVFSQASLRAARGALRGGGSENEETLCCCLLNNRELVFLL